MKKSEVLAIVISIAIIMIVISLFYHFFYFKSFHKEMMPASEMDKQKAIEILNKSVDISNAELKFGKVLPLKDDKLIEVKVIVNNSAKDYIVDLKRRTAMKK